jgi:hypothetical protein
MAGGKQFYSAELLAAYEFLDKFIQDNRRSTSKGDNHKSFIRQLRDIRNSIEEADILIDEDRGGVIA